MNKIKYFLGVALIISCLYQNICAAEALKQALNSLRIELRSTEKKLEIELETSTKTLKSELNSLYINLKNLEEKFEAEKPAPPEPSEPVPAFTRSGFFQYSTMYDNTGAQLRIGLVQGDRGTFNLVIYGPKLVKAQPEDFIINGKLTFPINKAPKIVWNPEGKIITQGPLASFVLVDGSKVAQAQEEAENTQRQISNTISTLQKDYSNLFSRIDEAKQDNKVISYVQEVNAFAQKVINIFKDLDLTESKYALVLSDIYNFLQQVDYFVKSVYSQINTSLVGFQRSFDQLSPALKAEKNTPGKRAYTLNQKIETYQNALNAFTQKDNLANLIDNVQRTATAVKEETPLEKLYDAYKKGTVRLSDWWVAPKPPKKEPTKLVEPVTPSDTDDVNLDELEEELEDAYIEYKTKTTIEERQQFAKTIQLKLEKYITKGGGDTTLRRWSVNLKTGVYDVPPLPTK